MSDAVMEAPGLTHHDDLGERIARLETALIGIDGTNGLRGEVRKQGDKIDMVIESLHDYGRRFDAYVMELRRETCYGVKALDDHKADHVQIEAAVLEVETKRAEREDRAEDRRLEDKKSRRTFLAAVLVAMISSIAGSSVLAAYVSSAVTMQKAKMAQEVER